MARYRVRRTLTSLMLLTERRTQPRDLLAAEVYATTWDFHDKVLVTRTPRSRSSSSLPMGLPFTTYSWIKGDLFRVTV
jgi:hypothetical protein